ncbi:MAG: hypothetical protein IJW46_04460 [Clostridia bacterium]|nr:hypothetical protein [Clostridia bacterium]
MKVEQMTTTVEGVTLTYRVFRQVFGDREGYTVTVREEYGDSVNRCELPDVTEDRDKARRIADFLCQNAVTVSSVYDIWVENFCS